MFNNKCPFDVLGEMCNESQAVKMTAGNYALITGGHINTYQVVLHGNIVIHINSNTK